MRFVAKLLPVITFAVWCLDCEQSLLGAEPAVAATTNADLQQGLVGYWKLRGDCRDHSGREQHAVNHGVDLANSSFDGRGAYLTVPSSESLQLGRGDFSISAWVHTDQIVDDTLGDVFSWYDPKLRRGVTLNLKASSGGYQSSGDDRHVYFGIDNGKLGDWQDCGRPSPTSNYVSNSLTVFDGHLYAANIDAQDEAGWCHVYRYDSGQKWIDCGRVGQKKTTGVMGLIVHQGHLYAGTSTYDWTRVFSGEYEPARVYRYEGGTTWTDCGQPSEMLRINCMATYGGKLYVGGDRGLPPPGEKQWAGRPYRVYVWDGKKSWSVAGSLPAEPPKNCYPHAMAVHDGKLYVGYPNVYAFDGRNWEFAGTPIGDTPIDQKQYLQVHSLEIYRGKLLAGMWPEARVVEHQGGEQWADRGRLGDGSEINALTVYNGKLYAGAIPRGEVSRYDDEQGWTSLHKFFSPPGWEPGPPTDPVRAEINNWTRVTSLTVYQGLLFASIGSCTSALKDAPAGVRGSVYSVKAGECISYDKDLGPGWKHLVAQRSGGELKLYVDGRMVAKSAAPFRNEDYDLSTNQPLRIGSGEQDFFTGRIREVRLYRRAITDTEIGALHDQQ
ncbi:MAG: hypothetical protein JWN70_2608 [Planctomycetaceae bacterium]|nr:hypothetical protein [Planctomycetaceae bacterium]